MLIFNSYSSYFSQWPVNMVFYSSKFPIWFILLFTAMPLLSVPYQKSGINHITSLNQHKILSDSYWKKSCIYAIFALSKEPCLICGTKVQNIIKEALKCFFALHLQVLKNIFCIEIHCIDVEEKSYSNAYMTTKSCTGL